MGFALEIVRVAYLPDVTLGRLRVGELELKTLEEPWLPDPDGPGGQRREGKLNESCVPDGEYVLTPHSGTQWKNVWRLSNPALGVYDFPHEIPPGQTWGRSAVLIHVGNTTDNIMGCIAVGRAYGRLNDKAAVLFSGDSINRLREVLGNTETHRLTIRPTLGTKE